MDNNENLKNEGTYVEKEEVRKVSKERREKPQNTIGRKSLLALLILALFGGGGLGLNLLGKGNGGGGGNNTDQTQVTQSVSNTSKEASITIKEKAIELNGKEVTMEEFDKFLEGLDTATEVTLRDSRAIKETFETVLQKVKAKGIPVKTITE